MKFLVRINTTTGSEEVMLSGEELLELSDKLFNISIEEYDNGDMYFSCTEYDTYAVCVENVISFKVIEEYEED